MSALLKPVNVKLLTGNFFRMLDNEWMLITAGDKNKLNTMTASWGTFGILWNKPIAIAFVRPNRYTFQLLGQHDTFSLTFFPAKYKNALDYCGSHSGKNVDKIAGSGLTPVYTEKGTPYFSEASLIFECKKIYSDNLKPENFVDQSLKQTIYPNNDFHHLFFGEIINCLSTGNFLPEKGLNFDREIDGNPADL